jgi:flavin-dependent dehydrogenase
LAGAELKDETTAISCEEQSDCVTVKLKNNDKREYFEKAKMVIDCSGVVCSIKRKIIHFPKNYIYTLQTFNKGSINLDYRYFYAYLQPEFSEYDAWFNVKDNYLIFGVAVKNKAKAKLYYSKFIEYMTQNYNVKINSEEKIEKWIMPHILPGCQVNYGIGRILFAGEAAGFLNPMGEGISAGLESGFLAAKAIQEVNINEQFNVQDIITTYTKNVAPLKTYMERQWQFVAGLSTKFGHMK